MSKLGCYEYGTAVVPDVNRKKGPCDATNCEKWIELISILEWLEHSTLDELLKIKVARGLSLATDLSTETEHYVGSENINPNIIKLGNKTIEIPGKLKTKTNFLEHCDQPLAKRSVPLKRGNAGGKSSFQSSIFPFVDETENVEVGDADLSTISSISSYTNKTVDTELTDSIMLLSSPDSIEKKNDNVTECNIIDISADSGAKRESMTNRNTITNSCRKPGQLMTPLALRLHESAVKSRRHGSFSGFKGIDGSSKKLRFSPEHDESIGERNDVNENKGNHIIKQHLLLGSSDSSPSDHNSSSASSFAETVVMDRSINERRYSDVSVLSFTSPRVLDLDRDEFDFEQAYESQILQNTHDNIKSPLINLTKNTEKKEGIFDNFISTSPDLNKILNVAIEFDNDVNIENDECYDKKNDIKNFKAESRFLSNEAKYILNNNDTNEKEINSQPFQKVDDKRDTKKKTKSPGVKETKHFLNMTEKEKVTQILDVSSDNVAPAKPVEVGTIYDDGISLIDTRVMLIQIVEGSMPNPHDCIKCRSPSDEEDCEDVIDIEDLHDTVAQISPSIWRGPKSTSYLESARAAYIAHVLQDCGSSNSIRQWDYTAILILAFSSYYMNEDASIRNIPGNSGRNKNVERKVIPTASKWNQLLGQLSPLFHILRNINIGSEDPTTNCGTNDSSVKTSARGIRSSRSRTAKSKKVIEKKSVRFCEANGSTTSPPIDRDPSSCKEIYDQAQKFYILLQELDRICANFTQEKHSHILPAIISATLVISSHINSHEIAHSQLLTKLYGHDEFESKQVGYLCKDIYQEIIHNTKKRLFIKSYSDSDQTISKFICLPQSSEKINALKSRVSWMLSSISRFHLRFLLDELPFQISTPSAAGPVDFEHCRSGIWEEVEPIARDGQRVKSLCIWNHEKKSKQDGQHYVVLAEREYEMNSVLKVLPMANELEPADMSLSSLLAIALRQISSAQRYFNVVLSLQQGESLAQQFKLSTTLHMYQFSTDAIQIALGAEYAREYVRELCLIPNLGSKKMPYSCEYGADSSVWDVVCNSVQKINTLNIGEDDHLSILSFCDIHALTKFFEEPLLSSDNIAGYQSAFQAILGQRWIDKQEESSAKGAQIENQGLNDRETSETNSELPKLDKEYFTTVRDDIILDFPILKMI